MSLRHFSLFLLLGLGHFPHTNLAADVSQTDTIARTISTPTVPESQTRPVESSKSARPTTLQTSGLSIQSSSSAIDTPHASIVSSTLTVTSQTSEATLSSHEGSVDTFSQGEPSSEDNLPSQPTITVAYGFAGAILMLSGAAYALVGLRLRQLYIFLASSYLVALAILVLILYVIRPPVSDAVQGAYVVAVTIPGLAAGGISLIFTDITEGLCCLFGGFCFSMWLLVLKTNGLTESTGGRAAIISVFSVVSFALYFVRYTRTHASIVSISVGGATVTVLGIDCYSRAGLKEFWVYIWGLNSQLFPLGTNTYPVTRGMKVEIACIVFITCIGMFSQMKLWRVVKRRRDERQVEEDREEEERAHREAQRGREVEAAKMREILQWERVYSSKTKAISRASSLHDSAYDSALESNYSDYRPMSRAGTVSSTKPLNVVSTESFELAPVLRPKFLNSPMNRTVSTEDKPLKQARDDKAVFVQERPIKGPRANSVKSLKSRIDSSSSLRNRANSEASNSQERPRSVSNAGSAAVAEPGDVPPVPSIVSTQRRSVTREASQSSLHAARDKADRQVARSSKLMSKPALVTHSRGSSVAATIDESSDDGKGQCRESTASSTSDGNIGDEATVNQEVIVNTNEKKISITVGSSDHIDTEDEQGFGNDAVDQQPRGRHGRHDSATAMVEPSQLTDTPVVTPNHSGPLAVPNTTRLRTDTIPDNTFHAAVTYRTSEWAKRLAEAENLGLDELGSDADDDDSAGEVAAPVQVQQLSRTATSSLHARGVQENVTSTKRRSSLTSIADTKRLPEVRQVSSQSLATVYDEGEQTLGNYTASASRSSIGSSLADAYPLGPARQTGFDDDDAMSLSSRRAELKKRDSKHGSLNRTSVRQSGSYYPAQHTQQHPWPHWPPAEAISMANEHQSGWPSVIQQAGMYDSHQPQRGMSVDYQRQHALFMRWREGLQDTTSAFESQSQQSLAFQPSLAMDRRLKEAQAAELRRQKDARDSIITEHMRTVLGQEGHKEAMRRMQSIANERT